jgi:ribosomal protein L30/L7E
MQMIHMDRRGKCNGTGVVKLHYASTTPAMSFTLKVLRLYKNTNCFYLKQSEGSKQELKKITQWGRRYLCYLFRPDKVAKCRMRLKYRLE